MKYELKCLYAPYPFSAVMKVDKDISLPVTEISDEDAAKRIGLMKAMGYKSYETSKAVVYYSETDARHITEYWFYKEDPAA